VAWFSPPADNQIEIRLTSVAAPPPPPHDAGPVAHDAGVHDAGHDAATTPVTTPA